MCFMHVPLFFLSPFVRSLLCQVKPFIIVLLGPAVRLFSRLISTV